MTPDHRLQLQIARTGDYNGIMRTTIFTFLGVAALIHFGPGGFSLTLAILVIATTAYGVLAGGVALDDIIALRDDMDDETRASAYGQIVSDRNIPTLKMISTALLALIGLAELLAVLM
ncbi:MAG: hypothetical protein QNJ35_11415 [Paracoccaceae bacterium]|nr:hypothetical protein [Paracoccaceae bacterium]